MLVRTMPRYYFHVHDGHEVPDEDGVDLSDDDDARTQAVIAAGEALRDTGRTFWKHPESATVCTLKFSATT